MSDSIYKKLTNALFKLSGGQAMPNEQSNVITHSFSGSTNFVAPSDGYVCLIAENSDNTWYRLSLIENAMDYLFNKNAGAYFGSGWFAVKKGATIESSLNSGVSGVIKFISSVGGGAKSLLSPVQAWIRGGVLWLTSSTRSELGAKVCLRLRKNGSGRNHIRQHLIPKRLTKASEITKTTYPRLMDTLMCKVIRVTVGSELTLKLYLYLLQQIRLAHQVLHFLSKKVHQWVYGVHLAIATLCGTLKIWLRNSLFAKEVCHA